MNRRIALALVLSLAGCGRSGTPITKVPSENRASGFEATARPEWVLYVRKGNSSRLDVDADSTGARSLPHLLLPLGEDPVWLAEIDSGGTAMRCAGPFMAGQLAGGFEARAVVVAAPSSAAVPLDLESAQIRVLHADLEWSPRARVHCTGDGELVVVEAGPTHVFSDGLRHPLSRLPYRLDDVAFSPARHRWAGMRADEYALNRVVVLDDAGQVVYERVVTKADYGDARVFGMGRWIDWVGATPSHELVRVVVDVTTGAVRQETASPGWDRRAWSADGSFVAAVESRRLRLEHETSPEAPRDTLWTRTETGDITDLVVRDDGAVAYHATRAVAAAAHATAHLVWIDRDNSLRSWTLSPCGRQVRGLRFVGRWLIEGFRGPQTNCDRVVGYDLGT